MPLIMIHYWLFSPIIIDFASAIDAARFRHFAFDHWYYAFDTPLSLRHYAIAISH
jgi:hypothetical protein